MTQKLLKLKIWKRKPIVVFTILFFLSIVFLAIKIAIPCSEYHYEGNYRFEQGIPTDNTVIYEGISLRPGVYRIVLEYETDISQAALCNVMDGAIFTGGLLSNGEHMYSGLGRTGYDIWLYEKTQNLQVVVSYGGDGVLDVGNLTIVETNRLWTMLLTIVLFLGAVVYAALIFRYYDGAYSVPEEKKNTFFWIMVISLIASVPYLCGYNIVGADLTYHLQRIEGVKDGLLGGQFPVRVEPRWLYDHGYACAIFYCNILLYFPAILRLLGFTITTCYNAYCIIINILTAWIAYYCFGKMFGERRIGIACSALYTLSVYRIYKFLITSATGEGSALTFLPLVIYGFFRIFTENPMEKRYKTAWFPVMIGFAGLMQTHVLTCEITVFVTVVFCLLHIRKVFRWNTFKELAKGAISSALVSLWFVVPFLDYYITQDVHIKNLSARTIQRRGGYLAHQLFHFWTKGGLVPLGENGMLYSYPEAVGMVLVLALGLFLILWFSGAFRKFDDARLSFVKKTALIGAVLLFMSMNAFPWDRLWSLHSITATLVSSLEFPHRVMGWATVCLVFVFGYCMWYAKQREPRFSWALAIAAFIGVTTSSMYLLDDVNRSQDYFELYNEESMGFGFISDEEYLIQGTNAGLLTFSDVTAGEGIELYDYEKSSLKAAFRCVNNTDADSFVDLPFLLYKRYQAIDVDTGKKLQVTANENYEVRVLVPAYFEGNLKVGFVSPLYWRISEIISLATVVTMAVMGWRSRRRRAC